MADLVVPIMYGIDVSLESLDIAITDDRVKKIPNQASDIECWLSSLPEHSYLAMEATGHYHEVLLDLALAARFPVYLINGRQLRHYREAVGPRAKTDTADALLLRRYLAREHQDLKPVKVLNEKEKKVWKLLKRRAAMVKARVQLNQSLGGLDETREAVQEITAKINSMIRHVERLMLSMAKELGWQRLIANCRSMPGIGPLNALALTTCYNRGDFRNSDQFVAFLGLDVRVRDSGKLHGKRKLTKRGDPEMRRLLFNAAMSFARDPRYKPLYDRLVERGLSSTAAYVILARKLVRVTFTLMKKDMEFDPKMFRAA
jgi:transposase